MVEVAARRNRFIAVISMALFIFLHKVVEVDPVLLRRIGGIVA